MNLKDGSVMKQLDPHGSQICDVVYCMKERAVLSSAWDGQLHVCEEGSLDGYSPNQDSEGGEALISTLQRR